MPGGYTNPFQNAVDQNYVSGWGAGSNCYTPDGGATWYSSVAGAMVNTYINSSGVLYDLYFLATTADQGPVTLTGGSYNWIQTIRANVNAAKKVDPKDFGAKADGQTATGSILVGLPTLSITTSIFVATDVGKIITVFGAGAAGIPLEATILVFDSPTSVTLSVNAATTVSNQVVWFGTNNLTALNNAISSAATLNKIVEFSEIGTYDVSGEISLASKTTFRSDNRPTIRQLSNNKSLIKSTGVNNLTIENLELVGLGVTDSCPYLDYFAGANARGISIYNATVVNINNCKISGFKYAGIVTAISGNVKITNNDIVGVQPPDGTNYSFGISFFSVGAALGAAVDGRNDIVIENNNIVNTSQAIWGGPGYTNVRIVENIIDGTAQHGMYVYAYKNYVIANNTISNPYFDGIKCQIVELQPENSNSIVLNDNIVTGARSGAWGIIVEVSKLSGEKRVHFENVQISDNIVTNSTLGGGIYTAGVRNVNIIGNILTRLGSYGIFSIDGGGTINDNFIHTTTWTGLYCRALTYGLVTLKNNTLVNIATDGANGALATTQRQGMFLEGSFLSSSGQGSAHAWAATSYYTLDEYVNASGNIYKCVTSPGGVTSITAPSHGAGTVVDGGVSWKFMNTVATLDAGDIHLKNNTVSLGDAGNPVNGLYLNNWTSPLRFGWSNNQFPNSKPVVAAGVAIQYNWNNSYKEFTSAPSYTGEIPGRMGREISGTAAPTTGNWLQGDICWNRGPVAAGVLLWICTVTGNPGTWRAIPVP
jgi:hypothetical protein